MRELIDRNIAQAGSIAQAMTRIGFDLPVLTVLDQVLARAHSDEATLAICEAVQRSGAGWFGMTRWNGPAALRISVSSFRTGDQDVTALIDALANAYRSAGQL